MNQAVGTPTHLVVLIRGNPRESHRPGEAVRIALGLAAGEHRVDIILLGMAPLLLTAELEDLVDGEWTEKYLTTLREYVETFYVGDDGTVDLTESDFPITRLRPKEIAQRMADADRFLIF